VKLFGSRFLSHLGRLSLAICLTTLACPACFGQTGDEAPASDEQAPVSNESLVDLLDPNTARALMDSETGATLQTLISPLHWGRLSLLSVSAYEGYDSNPELEKIPLGSFLTSINALAIYSIERKRSTFDVQYHPFFWFSQKQTYKDVGSISSDLNTEHPISEHWFWNAGDSFRYSPNLESTMEGNSFSADFGQGLTVGSPFLSEGYNMLGNVFTVGAQDRYGEWSSVRFRADANYIRLSEFLGGLSQIAIPAHELLSYGSGVAWTNRLSYRDTLDLGYDYQSQVSLDADVPNAQYHLATFTWSHLFTETFRLRAGVGPAWLIADSSGTENPTHRVSPTVQGSVELFKQFRKGGIALALARSDQFSGVIGVGFNNRVDLSLERRFRTRWNTTFIGSYLQQGILSGPNATGKQASAEIDYFLTRNWSIFGQGRYLTLANIGPAFAPQEIATLGIRWAWVPDKP
jgi:hypothetical protein